MNINRTKDGILYWTDYIDGKRVKRQNKNWKTKREAKEHYLDFMQRYENKETSLNEPSFQKTIDLYIDHISLSKKQSTVLRAEQMLKNTVAKYIPNVRISQINAHHIQEFQRQILQERYKSKGRLVPFSNRYLDILQGTLNDLLNYAVKFEMIDKNPFDVVPRVQRRDIVKTSQMTILTFSEYQAFLRVVDNPVYRALFDVLYWCGLRIGEAMALEIQDYQDGVLHVYKNFDTKNRIITTTKNDTSREVSVPDLCRKSLDELIKAYQESEGSNFDSSRPLFAYDNIIPKGTLDRHKNNYIKAANKNEQVVPYFTFHELRHTHVSTLIDLGLEAKDIADRLGHSVEMVNNTYSHLFPERKDDLLDKLNELGNNK